MLKRVLSEHIETAQKMEKAIPLIEEAAQLSLEALKNKKKILLCGNGGSAADAQHIAAELTGRFKKERKALSALALSVDTSALTAIGNDYGFEEIFSRQVEAHMKAEDILIAISTSGNSQNVINAIKKAKSLGGKVIVLTGKDGGKMKDMGDVTIIVPSYTTARIQEMHILIGHMICDMIDNAF